MDYAHISREGFGSFLASLKYSSGALPADLLALCYLRVSQINGCAYCVDAHYKEALKAGVEPRKLNSLCVWRDTVFYSAKECALLDFTESITLLEGFEYEAQIDELKRFFKEREIVDFAFAVANMNAMNRVAIAFAKKPNA